MHGKLAEYEKSIEIGGEALSADHAALRGLRRLALVLLIASLAVAHPAAFARAPGHALTIDDVLGLAAIDRVAISPDGAWAAVTIIRLAGPGEVYGRTNYEWDTSRADVWLVSRAAAMQRRL